MARRVILVMIVAAVLSLVACSSSGQDVADSGLHLQHPGQEADTDNVPRSGHLDPALLADSDVPGYTADPASDSSWHAAVCQNHHLTVGPSDASGIAFKATAPQSAAAIDEVVGRFQGTQASRVMAEVGAKLSACSHDEGTNTTTTKVPHLGDEAIRASIADDSDNQPDDITAVVVRRGNLVMLLTALHFRGAATDPLSPQVIDTAVAKLAKVK